MNQGRLWQRFFRDADPNLYSIYSHPKWPEKVTQNLIKDHIIGTYYPTQIHTISEVLVQLGLLKEVYKDPDNYKAVLISNSCIPLHPFNYVYDYLTKDDKGHIGINLGVNFADPIRTVAPYNLAKMHRHNRLRWNALPHKVKATLPFSEFVKYRNEGQCWNRKMMKFFLENNFTSIFTKMPIPCEHYFGNVLIHIGGNQDWIHVNNLTFAYWPVVGHLRNYKFLSAKELEEYQKEYLFMRKILSNCVFERHPFIRIPLY